MSKIIEYQLSNILDNFYTDGHFNYIFTSSLYSHPDSFNDITSYAKLYIPSWQPVSNQSNNRIIFNSGTMFELIFYKNIILLIPLYISNYSILENNIFHIKNYCEKLIYEEEKKNAKLINAIGYKLYVYSCTTVHPGIKYNTIYTSITILGTNLYTNMYESLPFLLTSATTYSQIQSSNNNLSMNCT